VDAALEQIGRQFTDADLSASRSAPIGRQGLDLTVSTEKTITLVDGGRRSPEVTTVESRRVVYGSPVSVSSM
jgi:hypothetical protein